MDFDVRQYTDHAAGHTKCYMDNRNMHFSVSPTSRVPPRSCPLGDPIFGARSRQGLVPQDIVLEGSTSSRKRIAVACARCRKRKIRCSGDPGDGSGCMSCKAAGVDLNMCQFHRVGSTDTNTALSVYARLIPDYTNSNIPLSLNNAEANSMYSREFSAQGDTRLTCSTNWTAPCSEETSTAETYNLDHPSSYTPANHSTSSLYDQRYRNLINRPSSHQHGSVTYQDQSASAVFGRDGLPPLHTSNLPTANLSEVISPLNMTSIESALPVTQSERPYQVTVTGAVAPQRHLPPPQPSPAPSRTTVDVLQDQRLRSAQLSAAATSMGLSAPYMTKSTINWNSSADAGPNLQNGSGLTSEELVVQNTTSVAPVTNNINESVMRALDYIPTTASSSSNGSGSFDAQPQLNFSTSSLLESMISPASTTTYSNFRNYNLPTTSSSNDLAILARNPSQNNSYTFSTDRSAKRTASGGTSDRRLISGQSYVPLSQQSPMQVRTRKTFDIRPVTVQSASMSSVNHGF